MAGDNPVQPAACQGWTLARPTRAAHNPSPAKESVLVMNPSLYRRHLTPSSLLPPGPAHAAICRPAHLSSHSRHVVLSPRFRRRLASSSRCCARPYRTLPAALRAFFAYVAFRARGALGKNHPPNLGGAASSLYVLAPVGLCATPNQGFIMSAVSMPVPVIPIGSTPPHCSAAVFPYVVSCHRLVLLSVPQLVTCHVSRHEHAVRR